MIIIMLIITIMVITLMEMRMKNKENQIDQINLNVLDSESKFDTFVTTKDILFIKQ